MLETIALEPTTDLALLAPAVPFVQGSGICLEPETAATLRQLVRDLHELTHAREWAQRVDADADEVARHSPGNCGVFMGYDVHLTPDGPRLIEVNTNAGGALLNGLHTWSRCGSLCPEGPPGLGQLGTLVAETFRAEFRSVRGPVAELRRVALVDHRPREQFLWPEFELAVTLLRAQGIEADIVCTQDLDPSRYDLVYWRDTDFQLEAPRSRRLREAYLEDRVVVTPTPREHHLIANKERLTLFSSPDELMSLGLSEEAARRIAQLVPESHTVSSFDPEVLWSRRKEWVFKPAALHGSRAVYRGDKLSRKRFEQVLLDPSYLVQRRVPPGALDVQTEGGQRKLKVDVRAYAYRDQVLWFGARAYQGQVTNMRSAGGGFAAICDC
ncbi:MAG: hypothetical protein AAGK22_20720 [Acidobacteriota bacterium]